MIPHQTILAGDRLSKTFHTGMRGQKVMALSDVSLHVADGEALGIVGESGSGKSTLARILIGLEHADAGTVTLDGKRLDPRRPDDRARLIATAQMVFQDSAGSLNPRLSVLDTIAFGLRARRFSRAAAAAIARETLGSVGLPPERFAHVLPQALSGGQRQRVNIARALALNPRVLMLDEPVSALDKSVEAQVLNLLVELRARRQLTLLFISHDLAVVRYFCDRVMVMQGGRVVETGPVDAVFDQPAHDYTRTLIANLPRRRVAPPLPNGERVMPA